VLKFDVYGTLTLGSAANESFRFVFPTNIIVYRDGTMQERTFKNQILSPQGTIITIYPGGKFDGNSTTIETYTASRSTIKRGTPFTLGSRFAGPYTIGMITPILIQSFQSVTYILAGSGIFGDPLLWLGGIVPLPSVCILVGGCGMSVSPGYRLSTVGLVGELNINFHTILIAEGSVLQLGEPGLNIGFRFRYRMEMNCRGTLEDVSGGNRGIFLPVNSKVNFFASSTFMSAVATKIQTYDPVTNSDIGTALPLEPTVKGPYYVETASNGSVSSTVEGRP
jgi:hypothetical protein